MAENPVTVSFQGGVIDPENFTLPDGFSLYEKENAKKPDLVLSLGESLGAEGKRRFIYSNEFLVPLRSPGDYRNSMSLNEIKDEGFELVPLDEWEHSGLGIMVDGFTPADIGYPLVRWKFIDLTWKIEPNPALQKKIETALADYLDTVYSEASPDLIWIGAVGDMMLQRGIEDVLIDQADGKERIFSDLLPHLSGFDLLMGNLEGAVTRNGSKTPKSFNFRFRPEVLKPLGQTGFDYLSLTNNHCYDYGEEGLLDTLGYLREYGIRTSGAGTSLQEALEPAIFSIGDSTFRILSVGAYPRERNGFDGQFQARVSDRQAGILWYGEDALSVIADFSEEEGIDIVMVHGGHEWQRYPDTEQRNRYRSLIDAGADIVLGSHPHVLQGVEHYNGGIIYYSLGNFLFNGMEEMPYAEDSLVASLGICGDKILYRRDIPVQIDGPYVKKDRSGRIIQQFKELSDALKGW